MGTEAWKIWTIGHSTRSAEEFVELLRSFSIGLVVDVRHFPGSRKYPQYGKEELQEWLPAAGVGYAHLEDLGGRRRPLPDSPNTGWRHPNFRGYADYMQTDAFAQALLDLQHKALHLRAAYMCSEAVWWRCHRSLISDALKAAGWEVQHIMSAGVSKEHPYTAPARVVRGRLVYGNPDPE